MYYSILYIIFLIVCIEGQVQIIIYSVQKYCTVYNLSEIPIPQCHLFSGKIQGYRASGPHSKIISDYTPPPDTTAVDLTRQMLSIYERSSRTWNAWKIMWNDFEAFHKPPPDNDRDSQPQTRIQMLALTITMSMCIIRVLNFGVPCFRRFESRRFVSAPSQMSL